MWLCKYFLLILIIAATCNTRRISKRQVENDGEKRIACYYTNWSGYRVNETARFTPDNINPFICTHIMYAFVNLRLENNSIVPFDEWQDITKGGYMKVTDLKSLNEELKVLVSVGGWNAGSGNFSSLVRRDQNRAEFVQNAIAFLREHRFDGLDVAWQFPAFRDGSSPDDKVNYGKLITELRRGFEKEAEETGQERLQLSVVMSALSDYINQGYDVPVMNENLDFINLVTYDYHLSSGPIVNHHSPLFPSKEDLEDPINFELNVDSSIRNLITRGASPEKVNLGIPTYGRIYMLENPGENVPGSPAIGGGVGNVTAEPGTINYYEFCKNLQNPEWTVVRNLTEMGPYAFSRDQWVGFDDPESVKRKGEYARERGIGGLMFWTIDDDDFRGECHGRGNPLIRAGREGITGSNRFSSKPRPPIRRPNPQSPPSSPTLSADSGASAENPPFFQFPLTFQNLSAVKFPWNTTDETPMNAIPSLFSFLFRNNVFYQDIKLRISQHYHAGNSTKE